MSEGKDDFLPVLPSGRYGVMGSTICTPRAVFAQ